MIHGEARDPQVVLPRIAAVIPCYNDGATLEDAVRSIRSQGVGELVVVNDGSTDPTTHAVLRRLPGDVQVVHQRNRGLAAARNAGAEVTSAPYLLFLDADDEVAAGALEALAGALDADASAVLAWGDAETFGDFTSLLRSAPALDPWRLTYISDIAMTCLIRRDAFVAVGGWKPLLHEDWDLWLSFVERGWHGVYVPRPAYRWRIHGPRMWRSDYIPRHAAAYEELKQLHRSVFEQRWSNWLRSRAPLRLKIAFPLVSLLPLSAYGKHRLRFFLARPRSFLKRTRNGRTVLRYSRATS